MSLSFNHFMVDSRKSYKVKNMNIVHRQNRMFQNKIHCACLKEATAAVHEQFTFEAIHYYFYFIQAFRKYSFKK
jgi:hypothetical protein